MSAVKDVQPMGWTRRDFARYFQAMVDARRREIARVVKYERERKGLSAEGLAFRAGVSSKTVSRIETASIHEPRPGTWKKIADALEMPVEKLTAPLYINPPTTRQDADAGPLNFPDPGAQGPPIQRPGDPKREADPEADKA